MTGATVVVEPTCTWLGIVLLVAAPAGCREVEKGQALAHQHSQASVDYEPQEVVTKAERMGGDNAEGIAKRLTMQRVSILFCTASARRSPTTTCWHPLKGGSYGSGTTD